VQLIVINSNDTSKVPDDSFPKMKERAQAKHFNFPYLFDESQEVAQAYGAERTPEVFVFDKQGQLRHHGAIGDNYDTPSAAKLPHLRAAPRRGGGRQRPVDFSDAAGRVHHSVEMI
jgi:AhpC/TSA family